MIRLKPGQIALAAGALALGFALAWTAVHRSPIAANPAPEAAASADPADPLAALAQAAAAAPQDPSTWRALAAAQFDAGLFADAAASYEKAAGLAPAQAAVWSALGEARVMASKSDPMPAPALEAFRKAASLDPKDPRARYFLAVNRDLSGDHTGAIADWLALLAETPPGAPWEGDLKRTIEQVGKIHKIDVAPRIAAVKQPAASVAPHDLPLAAQGIPGPTAADLQSAGSIPPSQQRQMAETMVARLEGKLRDNPANIEGWIMLMRSRVTLGQADRASAALKAAVAANPAQAGRLKQEAGVLGVQ